MHKLPEVSFLSCTSLFPSTLLLRICISQKSKTPTNTYICIKILSLLSTDIYVHRCTLAIYFICSSVFRGSSKCESGSPQSNIDSNHVVAAFYQPTSLHMYILRPQRTVMDNCNETACLQCFNNTRLQINNGRGENKGTHTFPVNCIWTAFCSTFKNKILNNGEHHSPFRNKTK